MPASPIRKLSKFADKAKSQGTKVYHLNIGQPDLFTPPEFFDTIRKELPSTIEYTDSAGIPTLREKTAAYYKELGINISKENVLVTTGGSEAILFALHTCLDPGDEIITLEPFYTNYNGFAMMSEITICPITTSIGNNFALPPIEKFEAAITDKTKAVLICNPSNPTGVVYSQRDIEKLASICRRHDLYLMADEVYRDFCYTAEPFFSTLSLADMDDRVIVFDSISKRFSACGSRIGFLITRNAAISENVLKFAQARLSSPTIGQIAAEALFDLPKLYYDEVRKIYQKRRDVLIHELRAIPEIIVPDVTGAFYVVIKLPVDNAEHFCQWLLESFTDKGETVMLAPAEGFYKTPGLGKQEVRIAYVLKEEALVRAVEIIKIGLKVYNKKAN